MDNNRNNLILGLTVFFLVASGALPVQAAQTETTQTTAKVQAPIVFEGEDISFNEATGEIYARGNVKITQNGATILADDIQGNTQQGDVQVNGSANFLEPAEKVNLVGLNTSYNYHEHTGSMLQISGTVDKERVTGQNLEFLPDKYIIHNGTMTKCPAIVPDYHVSARKIEIWPGDRLVAHDVKFWIKKTVIYSTKRYSKDLREGATESAFPSIGYSSDDGMYIRQRLEYPLANRVSAYASLAYYSQAHFKPAFGIVNRESNYTLGVHQGHFTDDDGEWIKKEPEYRFDYHSKQLGNLPVNYTFSASYGKWIDKDIRSWHQNYLVYFSHHPIKLDDTLQLRLGTGYEITKESYDGSTVSSYRYDITLDKTFSPKLNTWVGYHYTADKSDLFEFDNDDLNRELRLGATYRFDKLNALTYSQTYDLDKNRVHDQDFTWHRNLHCWQADITYRAERSQVKVQLHTIGW